jgi:hypothetical protein
MNQKSVLSESMRQDKITTLTRRDRKGVCFPKDGAGQKSPLSSSLTPGSRAALQEGPGE